MKIFKTKLFFSLRTVCFFSAIRYSAETRPALSAPDLQCKTNGLGNFSRTCIIFKNPQAVGAELELIGV